MPERWGRRIDDTHSRTIIHNRRSCHSISTRHVMRTMENKCRLVFVRERERREPMATSVMSCVPEEKRNRCSTLSVHSVLVEFSSTYA
jgi:hypothetical protein